MNILSKFKRLSRKTLLAGAVTAAALVGGLFATNTVSAAGADCDNNAVITGGVGSAGAVQTAYANGTSCTSNGVTYRSSASSIQKIFSCMGISNTEVNNLRSGTVNGYVTKGGNVYAYEKNDNGTTVPVLVATGAITGGRQSMPGSTNHTTECGTPFYERSPSVSFQQDSLPALIDLRSGVFQFAIINSCGNPVKATPKRPAYKVEKLVSQHGANNFQNSVTVKSGAIVDYKIVVTSTGDIPAEDITVSDQLGKDIVETPNTLVRKNPNGNLVNGNDAAFFGSGVTINSLDPGHSVTFRFGATVGNADDTSPQCVEETLPNTAAINSPVLPKQTDSANVSTKCTPQPVYTCDSLTAAKNSDTQYTFTAASTAKNGAVLSGYIYNFGDGTTSGGALKGASIAHTYTAPGTYTAQVTAFFAVNGNTRTVTSQTCKVTVTIPSNAALTCDSLSATPDQNDLTNFTFNAAASASNGASITGYSYDFGDGNTVTNPSTATTNSTTHQYTQLAVAKTYTITVTALGSVNGVSKSVTSPSCKTTVNVPPKNQSATCTGLTLTPAATPQFTYNATATYATINGAVLTSSSFNWGDGSAATPGVNANGTIAAGPHTYQSAGPFTVTATLSFNSSTGAALPTVNCSATVNGPQPVYTCDTFTITPSANRTVTVSNFKTTTGGGATFSNVDVNWGDNNTANYSNVVGQTHQYAADGTYTITATAHFMVNGQDVTASGANCVQQVSYSTEVCTPPSTGTPPNCVTPCKPPTTGTPPNCVTPPTVLVNTGAGSVAGLFAAASILGTFIYRRVLTRRLLAE